MRFVVPFLIALAGPGDESSELSALRARAETILEQNQSLEITTSEARRRVQLLLKDFRAWAELYQIELQTRNRTYRTPPKQIDEPLTTDRCPLFFEEELDELCPLDLARSEVWAASVVHCRYLCE